MGKLRPPVKWFGGKHYLAKDIISHFPEHEVYVEVCGGMASVLLNKPPAPVEIYNDLDHMAWNLFRVLRHLGPELHEALELTPYSRHEFERCVAELGDGRSDPVERARRFYVVARQSFGGMRTSWSSTKGRARGGMAGDANAWWSSIEALPDIIHRLRATQIENLDAITCVRKYDSERTLFYIDPPYVHSTRTSKNAYVVEMTDEQHRELGHVLKQVRGKVVLSGYDCPLYEELYDDWRRVEYDLPNNAAGGAEKRRMIECLWFNYGSG